jgi:hypothetical protein
MEYLDTIYIMMMVEKATLILMNAHHFHVSLEFNESSNTYKYFLNQALFFITIQNLILIYWLLENLRQFRISKIRLI